MPFSRGRNTLIADFFGVRPRQHESLFAHRSGSAFIRFLVGVHVALMLAMCRVISSQFSFVLSDGTLTAPIAV
ncbi:uncharacterized protein ARMOST_08043 [Armillaria ostoyae]|uniref:Uncharacterized protein n=1 Tax=Armillaria ostoyae TaxID=47428 RepID=A0A284R7L5_ARMOS|nr:uncharacterized protein ARMOST_08043 [Armillaria ostoyae]